MELFCFTPRLSELHNPKLLELQGLEVKSQIIVLNDLQIAKILHNIHKNSINSLRAFTLLRPFSSPDPPRFL